MELVGEEKRIQALFSEVRLADEQTTPSFVGVWNRAQSRTVRTPRAFNRSFAMATALLVFALVSLAWWMNRSQPRQQAAVATVPSKATDGPNRTSEGQKSVVKPLTARQPAPGLLAGAGERLRAPKLATTRHQSVQVAVNKIAVSKKELRDAKAIESWQSPTATLLDSTSDELLKSLPQLNQTVDELKSFLPSRPK